MVWVVAGAPGAGKTTVAGLLAARLSPPAALIDKDTVYGGFVAATLAAAGRPNGEREGPWYDDHIKIHEYAGLAAVTREVRGNGCPVILVAPFTGGDPYRFGVDRVRRIARWRADPADLGGDCAIGAARPAGGARLAAGHRQAGGLRLVRRPDAIGRGATGAAPRSPELRQCRRSGYEPETRTIGRCRCRVRLIRSLPMTTPIAEQGTDLHNQRLSQIDALIPAAPAPVPADGESSEVPGAIGLARSATGAPGRVT